MYMGGDGITVKEFAVAAEAAGFDSVWTGDHLAHYVDGIASLGIVAGCTERVTVGSNVLVAPFRPAAGRRQGVADDGAVGPPPRRHGHRPRRRRADRAGHGRRRRAPPAGATPTRRWT